MSRDLTKRCRSCGAPLAWAKTESGRWMPLDEAPVEDGNIALAREGRDVVALNYEPLSHGGRPRYQSHYVSCPCADQWRGTQRKRGPNANPR